MTGTEWWRSAAIYQIYPRSFQDSNGDGVGDLEGIRRRLGHLTELGVDAVWISPFYPSPMADFGYDVSDYCGVDPLFGTLEDFDRLLAEAHALGLKVILDFVPNHTSDQHPWFLESRSSRENPKRDWYLWRDPAPGGLPPNNWISNFGGPAWTYDEATGQHYHHAFLSQQPDLNWRSPEVRAAMADAMRFWLDRGVDGFRVDVMWHVVKDADFRDNLPNPGFLDGSPEIHRLLQTRSADQPEAIAVAQEMRALMDDYGDRLLIGEIYLPVDRLVAYYGPGLSAAHLPFNFHLILTPWNAPALAELIRAYEAAIPEGGWPNWVLGNHDQKRVATRIGAAQARVAAMLLLTLRGTPTIYYGDEIGMADVAVPPEALRDPWALNEPGVGGRDPCRTPMAWDGTPNGGFSDAPPWLPMSDPGLNVAAERVDPRSIYALHKRLLALRRDEPALSLGGIVGIVATDDVLSFERTNRTKRFRVVLNLGSALTTIALRVENARIALSTHLDREDEAGSTLSLRADEGLLIEL